MTGNYGVKIVGDDTLPGEHEWVFVRTGTGLVLLLERSAACSQRVLAEVWAARRSMRARGAN